MKIRALVISATLLAASCSASDEVASPDVATDAADGPDATSDVQDTAQPDAGPDTTGATDAATDAVTDAATDAATDAVTDAVTDGSADGGHDATAPDSGDSGPEPLPKGETTWLARHDGVAAGHAQYTTTPEKVFEYQRFEIEQPVRIWSLRAQLAVPVAADATLFVWDDFGGNFFNFRVEPPLAAITRTVTPADSEQWLTFELPYPVELDPGRMFYAGLVVDGDAAVQLAVDAGAETPEGAQPSSLIWLSAEPPDAGGFPALAAAPGDYLIEAEVELVYVVPEPERDFELIPPEELGITGFSRIAVADVDSDSDLDVMTDGPRLYLNDGEGHFTEATAAWLEGISGHNGGVFGDYDNDGDPDYFATGHSAPQDRLLRNDGDHFTDVTAESGIDDSMQFNCNGTEGVQPVPTEAAAWVDLDNDGFIDLYQANFICWEPPAKGALDLVWRNRGDGTFEDMTKAWGADAGQLNGLAGRGVAPADADGDGLVDVLVTNYRLHKDFFFHNTGSGLVQEGADNTLQGKGTFSGGAQYYGHSIGAAWGDVDEDGDLDVFVARLAHPRFITFSQRATLYENPGGPGVFEDVTEAAGIRYLETPSNPNLWDYDNDGDLDLFFTCIYEARTSQLYRNDGHPAWKEVTYPSGLAVYNGWGSAVADIDGDGDLDLLAGGGQSFRNRNPMNRKAIFVKLVGRGAGGTSRDAIGARVTAMVGDRVLLRERFGAHGTGVQDSPWLHIGLDGAPSATLHAHFPATGQTVVLEDVEAGARVVIEEE